MNVLETDQWCLLFPQEWRAENKDNLVRIVDSDEVGELEITTLSKKTGVVESDELFAMAQEESPEVTDWVTALAGSFSGVTGGFIEDGSYICEWYVAAGTVLLYITYSCSEENAHLDAAVIEEILRTLTSGDSSV